MSSTFIQECVLNKEYRTRKGNNEYRTPNTEQGRGMKNVEHPTPNIQQGRGMKNIEHRTPN